MQHARLPCPSPTPRASCPSNQWCPPTILSSVIPFSSHLQSFPASIFSKVSVLHIRWPKYWSFRFSISPPNEYSGLISFRMSNGLSRVCSNTTFKSINSSALSFLYSLSIYDLIWSEVGHNVSSKKQASFNFMAEATICSDFGAQKTLFQLFSHLFAMKWWDQMPWSSFSECWVLSQLFHSPLSLSSRGSLVLLHFLPLGWYYLHIWGI